MPSPRASCLLVIPLAALLAACGGSTGTSAPATPASSGAVGPTGSAPASVAFPSIPAGSIGAVGGTWTAGAFKANVSGDVTLTIDAPLLGGQSMTAGAATILTYGDATTADGIAVSVAITEGGNGLTISGPKVTAAGGSGSAGSNCAITLTQSEPTAIAGNIQCTDVPAIFENMTKSGTIDLSGTFEATR